ncbi:SDR family oxidoreductase [Corynebacterium felinum]|uniref:NADP-dependent 3-hydroxy acid dehydrogenase YdfG n=1 Tax=Corynebacterium felinum TaxID=131318 RepID=A0ABU2B6W3_9CORY|nr:SDR family oxidoreductase [Corynebacterium felinum]MDF5819779.1 SDR family oxidoreductase [Corynebacterium felinum]MDR7354352.1 NADP-dependent 3-hydroxy acid dehydrogenase YdfG [Corynebacterium felinum]WJY93726.1 Serine 3-dehydrogenase [Corynebacterium felinum]
MTFPPHNDPNDPKIAVVTGASSGIGEATARALAADGWTVIVAARRTEPLEALAEEINGIAIPLDVTNEESVANFAQQIPICHLLVNNAGGAKGLDPIAETSIEDWEWMYDTNVLGTLRVTKALLNALTETQGHIINMSSVAGITAYAGGAGYNAAKFGVTAMNKVMRIEFVERNLRVTELNPGRVKTDFSLVRFKGDQAKADAVYADKLNLSAEDIAETIRWVAQLPPHMNIDRMVITPRDQVI